MFKVFTTIAPRDIFHQQVCIDTWHNHDLEVIAFNHPVEIDWLKDEFKKVKFIPTIERGFVKIDYMIDYAKSLSDQFYCYMNSDIRFKLYGSMPEFLNFIADNIEDSLILNKRIETKGLGIYTGDPASAGMDTFFFNNKALQTIPKSNMKFGKPRWDDWFLYWPKINGIKLKLLLNRLTYHVEMPIRWNYEEAALYEKEFKKYGKDYFGSNVLREVTMGLTELEFK
jgi:hypothetical protein